MLHPFNMPTIFPKMEKGGGHLHLWIDVFPHNQFGLLCSLLRLLFPFQFTQQCSVRLWQLVQIRQIYSAQSEAHF